MYLFTLARKTRYCIVPALLLMLWNCSAVPRDPQQPVAAPFIKAPLSSPLLTHAGILSETKPEKNQVSLLEVGKEALLARVHLIRSAKRSIAIQTIIWVNDETGRLLVYELIQAAHRGVQVELLIDHLASEQNLAIAAFLANVHPNLHVKLFNPIIGLLGVQKADPSLLDKLSAVTFSFNRLNQRMHNKVFLVDDLIGITGGRNYQNAYYDLAGRMNYKDRDIMVIGPVVREMRESFDCYWQYERSVNIKELADVKRYRGRSLIDRWQDRESFQLHGFFDDIDRQAKEAELIRQRFIEPLVEVDHAYFIADDPNKTERYLIGIDRYSKITQELADLVSRAEQSVHIQTPYLVLTSPAIALFRKLRKQHPAIDIRISTNSLAATDSWYVYALSYKQKKTYLNNLEFKIYEFKPLPGDMPMFMPGHAALQPGAAPSSTAREKEPYLCLHAKSLVLDDYISFIGSYNLDPRSENINTECGLVIKDRPFSHLLRGLIETDMEPQNSWVIARKKRLAGVDEVNSLLVELSDFLPFIDIWPFRYAASFELIEGKQPVTTDHADFYENYRDVGSFPQVRNQDFGKEIGARGTKAFLSFVKPLL